MKAIDAELAERAENRKRFSASTTHAATAGFGYRRLRADGLCRQGWGQSRFSWFCPHVTFWSRLLLEAENGEGPSSCPTATASHTRTVSSSLPETTTVRPYWA